MAVKTRTCRGHVLGRCIADTNSIESECRTAHAFKTGARGRCRAELAREVAGLAVSESVHEVLLVANAGPARDARKCSVRFAGQTAAAGDSIASVAAQIAEFASSCGLLSIEARITSAGSICGGSSIRVALEALSR